jgi:hypothetical protein
MLKTIFRTFVLGLGVGVLVAPRPGHETRQLLTEKFNQLFNQNGNTSASEWDRPVLDTADATVTPSQHYTKPVLDSPSTVFGGVSSRSTGTTSTGSASPDSDPTNSTDI